MNILVTNDDGINSPGLAAAAEAAAGYGRLFIAAPSGQKTASGRSLIGSRNDYFHETEISAGGRGITAWHIDCAPALVLKMAFETVFRGIDFDLAVSGINYGENIGSDITLSGTVGAAFEAAANGIPSIAVSLQTSLDNHFNYGKVNWDTASHNLSMFIGKFSEKRAFRGFDILKIDIPASADKNTGWEITRLTDKPYYRNYIENGKPGSRVSDLKVKINDTFHKEGTDVHTLNVRKKVSVTPLSFDFSYRLTDDIF